MPDYVLKHKESKGAFVLSLPLGSTDEDLKVALSHYEGWSLDSKTEPQDVAAAQEAVLAEAAASAPNSTPKGK